MVELDNWLTDVELHQITHDIGQAVTTFIVNIDDQFHIRWFALDGEINLCGHGSLGAGAAILPKYKLDSVVFFSEYGEIAISNKNGLYTLVLPSWEGKTCKAPTEIRDLAAHTVDVFSTRDLVLVFSSVEEVSDFQADDERLKMVMTIML